MLSRADLAETCVAMAKRDVFWTGVVMIVVSLWIAMMWAFGPKEKGIPPQMLFIWIISVVVILRAALSKGRKARLIREKVRLGQFRLHRCVVRHEDKGKLVFYFNGNAREIPRHTIGRVYVEKDEDCFMLMIDGKPEAIFRTRAYTLGSDLEEKLTSCPDLTR